MPPPAADGTTVDIQFASAAPGIPPRAEIVRWVRSAVAMAECRDGCEVAVRVVDADEMQALNRTYRGKDRPTNVLSFPANAFAAAPDAPVRCLGDVVVCAPVVLAEAAAQRKAPAAHWAHLLVHGTLHLLGFDHETAAGAAVMEGLEVRILAAGGVGDPYREQ